MVFGYFQIMAQNNHHELIICGWDRVFIVDMSRIENNRPQQVWSWRSDDHPEMPAGIRSKFKSTDECKPVENGSKILITSSGGGVALVERETGNVIFYSQVANAHSAELLPANRLAVAASRHAEGNQLVIFDIDKSDIPIYSVPLESGHGVVWDEHRTLLWALGYDKLKAYKLVDWSTKKPSLSLVETYDLPEHGGHDLYPLPNSNIMSISTSTHCWIFDRDTGKFDLHPWLASNESVKAISVNPVTNQLVYIQADTSWWSENLRFLNPDLNIYYSGEHFYKARWNTEIK